MNKRMQMTNAETQDTQPANGNFGVRVGVDNINKEGRSGSTTSLLARSFKAKQELFAWSYSGGGSAPELQHCTYTSPSLV